MNPSLPFVSCMMPTYGRATFHRSEPNVVEEAIHSFLEQDYDGQRELVVVNDLPEQKLRFDHPEVRIINVDKKFHYLGEKRNFVVEQCRGTHILVWDDDDIYLPWAIRVAVECIGDMDWCKAGALWWTVNRVIQGIRQGPACNQFLFRKDAWERVGKYPNQQDGGEDRIFEQRLLNARGAKVKLPPSKYYLLYGWGGHVYHASGQGDDPLHARMVDHVRKKMREKQIRTGDVELVPRWRYDYVKETRDWLRGQGQDDSTPALAPMPAIPEVWESKIDKVNHMMFPKSFCSDGVLYESVRQLCKKYGVQSIFETGSFDAESTEALAFFAPRVMSVELKHEYAQRAKMRMRRHHNVTVVEGNSHELIQSEAGTMAGPTLFYLDAKWYKYWPLRDELTAIATHKIKPIIVIRDCKNPNHPELGFDSYGGFECSLEYVKPWLDNIYGPNGYNVTFNDTAGGAARGVMFVEPVGVPLPGVAVPMEATSIV